MEEQHLDYILVPLGLLVFTAHHAWLLCNIMRKPFRTVIRLNATSRHQWVFSMMTDLLKNGVLTVQTIRNNIMASTLLAIVASTLSSVIGIFAISTWSSSDETAFIFGFGNKTYTCATIKRLSVSVCFLVAFLCNVQSIRYYAHVSFLIIALALKGKKRLYRIYCQDIESGKPCLVTWDEGILHVFPLFLWIYGPCLCLLVAA
ncbi:hypothetical protein L6164_008053 [Bauhinia variegata]|uniref:Uncharacterized protein n=1 Tax=Bauhinia variegata TaxID=167791 RepID=A0ACB9PFH3_BAUVA|nr:hypothetical protein L6164_008053 [Bauhinia variegata]